MMKKLITALLIAAWLAQATPTVAIGDLVLEVTSSNTAVLMLQLQKTDDLTEEWEDAGPPVRWEAPVSGGEFFKVQASGEEIMAYTLTYIQSSPTTYKVSGYTGTPVDVVVPPTYNGKAVTALGTDCFRGSTSLVTISLPASVTDLGINAFRECASITGFVIPDTVTDAGDATFRDCTSLVSIEIPDSVTELTGSFCYGCSSLTSITFPDTLADIQTVAFRYCTALVDVDLPASLTDIGDRCFQGCTGMAGITMTGNAPALGVYVFDGVSATAFYPSTAIGYTNPWGGLQAVPYADHFSGIIFDTSITIAGSQKGKWLLTEGTGTTATDTSGNGNDGTITDGTWVTSLS